MSQRRTVVVRALAILLVVMGVLVPVVPVVGPLTSDDVLPLAGILLTAFSVPRLRGRLVADATLWAFAAFVLATLISSLANAESSGQFIRLVARSGGRLIFYVVLILVVRFLVSRGHWVQRALAAFVCVGTAEALFSVTAFITGYTGPYGIGVVGFRETSVLAGVNRVQGTFGGEQTTVGVAVYNPNFLAAYMVLCLPVTLGLFLFARRRAVRLVLALSMVAQIATLYATYTRAGFAALAFAGLAFGWLIGRRKLAAAVVIIGLSAALSMPSVRARFFNEKHDRYALYWAAGHILSEHALVGVGDGNYLKLIHNDLTYAKTPYGIATSTPHNSMLLTATTHGVLGGLAHLLLYAFVIATGVSTIRRCRGRRSRYLAAGITAAFFGFLLQDQSNNLAHVPILATQMWFLFALLPLCSRQRLAWFLKERQPQR